MGRSALIGLSVHDAEELDAPDPGAVDYLVAGTVYATPSHPDRTPGGPGLVRELARAAAAPLVAIGGITPSRVQGLLEAGAHGVAVRGGVWDAQDPESAVGAYLDELRRAVAPEGGT
jgi:thiamine-phosphate diphosphorylase